MPAGLSMEFLGGAGAYEKSLASQLWLILAALLVFGLGLMPTLRAPGEGLRVAVQGEQFWWRVRYTLPDGRSLTTANEIRLPRGQRAEVLLTAQDVIQSL